MKTKRLIGTTLLIGLGWTVGCADPCADDGLGQEAVDCPIITEGGQTESESDATVTESDSDGMGSCVDGIQNGDETDVDCGGSCENKCATGQGCGDDIDCQSEVCGDDATCQDPACDDGIQNGDETDVDCGGSCETTCDDGEGCGENEDCTSDICGDDMTCTPASCRDGIQNGDETDVDCGGSCPEPCEGGEGCEEDEDCISGICLEDGTCADASCEDGIQNGDETDVDCGGDTCDPCDDGEGCEDGEDCESGVCLEDGTCAEPTCDDGVQNGDETDVDCGGDTCDACDPGEGCEDGDDCDSGVCDPETGECLPPACDDGVQNGDETDEDCGGSCGSTCETDEMCTVFLDCADLVCDPGTNTCSAPTCTDGAPNGNETDVDCGGPDCPACNEPGFCDDNGDCVSNVCDEGQCVPGTCNDGVLNGSETDIDCGGDECAPCDDDDDCVEDEDCVSLNCDDLTNTCTPAACDDGIQNQGESDVDCGGPNCDPCDDGEMCEGTGDCESMVCDPVEDECEAATCNDGILNGDETDVDCGGPECTGCDTDEMCNDGTDCNSEVCNGGTCDAPTCADLIENGFETDVDCGGPDCDPCDDGEGCLLTGDCVSMVCLMEECQEAACNDGILNGDETDVDCGGSCQPCDDGEMCMDGDDCTSGVCDPATMTCTPPTCGDGVQNQDETDVDCGGMTCDACDDGEMCIDGDDCTSGVCDPATMTCTPPACDDGVLNGDETDLDCGGDDCGATCQPGEDCEDAGDCASAGCDAGSLTCNAFLSVVAAPSCSDYDGVNAVTLTAVASGGTGGPYTYAWTPDDGSLTAPNSDTTDAAPTGFATYTVTADDGANNANDSLVVVNSDPFDLENNCTLYTSNFLGASTASISYIDAAGDPDSTRACEQGNNDFGLHLCEDVSFENTSLTGTLEVTDDAGDNDMIGLVWGAQDNANFYSMTWKSGPQAFFGCTVPTGIVVKRVEAANFAAVGGADVYCPANTADSTILATPGGGGGLPATTNQAWVEGEAYEVVIEFRDTGSVITVTDESDVEVANFTIDDTTFTSGFFGSTTISQANACVGPLFGGCL